MDFMLDEELEDFIHGFERNKDENYSKSKSTTTYDLITGNSEQTDDLFRNIRCVGHGDIEVEVDGTSRVDDVQPDGSFDGTSECEENSGYQHRDRKVSRVRSSKDNDKDCVVVADDSEESLERFCRMCRRPMSSIASLDGLCSKLCRVNYDEKKLKILQNTLRAQPQTLHTEFLRFALLPSYKIPSKKRKPNANLESSEHLLDPDLESTKAQKESLETGSFILQESLSVTDSALIPGSVGSSSEKLTTSQPIPVPLVKTASFDIEFDDEIAMNDWLASTYSPMYAHSPRANDNFLKDFIRGRVKEEAVKECCT